VVGWEVVHAARPTRINAARTRFFIIAPLVRRSVHPLRREQRLAGSEVPFPGKDRAPAGIDPFYRLA